MRTVPMSQPGPPGRSRPVARDSVWREPLDGPRKKSDGIETRGVSDMISYKLTGLFLLVLMGLTLCSDDASGVIIYRLGTPFSAAEKDSLQNLGIDFRQLAENDIPAR